MFTLLSFIAGGVLVLVFLQEVLPYLRTKLKTVETELEGTSTSALTETQTPPATPLAAPPVPPEIKA